MIEPMSDKTIQKTHSCYPKDANLLTKKLTFSARITKTLALPKFCVNKNTTLYSGKKHRLWTKNEFSCFTYSMVSRNLKIYLF